MKTARQNTNGTRYPLTNEDYRRLAKEAKRTGKTVDQLASECLRQYFVACPVDPPERTVKVVTEIPVSKVKPFAKWRKADQDPVGLAMNSDGEAMLCIFDEENTNVVMACVPISLPEAVERFAAAMKPDGGADFDYTEGIGEFFAVVAKALKGAA